MALPHELNAGDIVYYNNKQCTVHSLRTQRIRHVSMMHLTWSDGTFALIPTSTDVVVLQAANLITTPTA